MAKIISLDEFIGYLTEQIGQPYVWGGQHLKLTPENYEEAIARRETDHEKRAEAIAYSKKLFDRGATVLYGYDCSGLGMWWLQNVQKVFAKDMNANGMMNTCKIMYEPRRGYWVFRLNEEGRATHIGYMVSDTEVVHAAGRSLGVIRQKFKVQDWHVIGKPPMFRFEGERRLVRIRGKSVRVRSGGSTAFNTIKIVHEGETYPLLGTAETGWYRIDLGGKEGFITNRPRYTEVIEK